MSEDLDTDDYKKETELEKKSRIEENEKRWHFCKGKIEDVKKIWGKLIKQQERIFESQNGRRWNKDEKICKPVPSLFGCSSTPITLGEGYDFENLTDTMIDAYLGEYKCNQEPCGEKRKMKEFHCCTDFHEDYDNDKIDDDIPGGHPEHFIVYRGPYFLMVEFGRKISKFIHDEEKEAQDDDLINEIFVYTFFEVMEKYQETEYISRSILFTEYVKKDEEIDFYSILKLTDTHISISNIRASGDESYEVVQSDHKDRYGEPVYEDDVIEYKKKEQDEKITAKVTKFDNKELGDLDQSVHPKKMVTFTNRAEDEKDDAEDEKDDAEDDNGFNNITERVYLNGIINLNKTKTGLLPQQFYYLRKGDNNKDQDSNTIKSNENSRNNNAWWDIKIPMENIHMVLLCLPFNEICEAGVKGYDIDEEEVDIFMKFHVKKVANWRSEATFWQSNLWQWEEKKIAQQDGSIDRISTLHFIFQSQKDHNNIDDVGCCCTCLKNRKCPSMKFVNARRQVQCCKCLLITFLGWITVLVMLTLLVSTGYAE